MPHTPEKLERTMKTDDPIRISIEEMLTKQTIEAIGADHAEPVVCVTRICGWCPNLKSAQNKTRKGESPLRVKIGEPSGFGSIGVVKT